MIPLLCDNLSSIQLAENPTFHARTKHIEVHYHFIREKVLEGVIDLKYVQTTKQVADFLTKGLAGPKLKEFGEKIGMGEAGVERDINVPTPFHACCICTSSLCICLSFMTFVVLSFSSVVGRFFLQ